jgi:hypothetical protein
MSTPTYKMLLRSRAASAAEALLARPAVAGSSTSPSAQAKIGDIAKAVLVLSHFEHSYLSS